MRNISPHKVVGGFNRKESQAISWIYATYYRAVFDAVFKLTGPDCPETEDLIAETFLKLFNSSARFDRVSRIRSFLLHVAKNLCLDYLKRKQMIRERLSTLQTLRKEMLSENIPEEKAEINELYLARIFEAVKKLTPKDRLLFTLSFMRGLSNEEVAEQLQVSSKTIANSKILIINKIKIILRNSGLLIILIILL